MIRTLIRAAIDGARKGIEEATPRKKVLVLRDADVADCARRRGRDVKRTLLRENVVHFGSLSR